MDSRTIDDSAVSLWELLSLNGGEAPAPEAVVAETDLTPEAAADELPLVAFEGATVASTPPAPLARVMAGLVTPIQLSVEIPFGGTVTFAAVDLVDARTQPQNVRITGCSGPASDPGIVEVECSDVNTLTLSGTGSSDSSYPATITATYTVEVVDSDGEIQDSRVV